MLCCKYFHIMIFRYLQYGHVCTLEKKIHPDIIMPILLTDFDFMFPTPTQTGPSLTQNFHEIITPKPNKCHWSSWLAQIQQCRVLISHLPVDISSSKVFVAVPSVPDKRSCWRVVSLTRAEIRSNEFSHFLRALSEPFNFSVFSAVSL